VFSICRKSDAARTKENGREEATKRKSAAFYNAEVLALAGFIFKIN
jgi:hypothetical protein